MQFVNIILFGIIIFNIICVIYAEQKKPNVLVILVDDVGTGDIPGYYNDTCKVTEMKNIGNLASSGVVFTNAHATPYCAPSRYSFLSGNYQFRGACNSDKRDYCWGLEGVSQFRSGDKSIADIFKSEGYNTTMMGKWHAGGKVPPEGRKSKDKILTHPDHDWSKALIGGPQDIGFSSSLITVAGMNTF